MNMPAVTEASQHDHMLPFLHHPSPGAQHHHDDSAPPPPQTTPYFGSYTVSVPQEHDQYYLPHAADIGPLSLLRQDVHGGGSYTHRPLAPLQQQQQQQSNMFSQHHHPYHRIPRLSPTQSRQYAAPRARRDRNRKASARQNGNIPRKGSFSPSMGYPRPGEEANAMQYNHVEDDGPDEEVTLDDKTPQDLRRLWDIRRKWLGKKGNGMWEDIMMEYYGEDHMTENKKTQVKAALQMKIHRMLLKHGKWPERDVRSVILCLRQCKVIDQS